MKSMTRSGSRVPRFVFCGIQDSFTRRSPSGPIPGREECESAAVRIAGRPRAQCGRFHDERRYGILPTMTKALKDALARVDSWPEWAQDNLADIAREIDREVKAGTYRATDEELRKIDEALAAVRLGEVASEAQVDAVFAKHRKA